MVYEMSSVQSSEIGSTASTPAYMTERYRKASLVAVAAESKTRTVRFNPSPGRTCVGFILHIFGELAANANMSANNSPLGKVIDRIVITNGGTRIAKIETDRLAAAVSLLASASPEFQRGDFGVLAYNDDDITNSAAARDVRAFYCLPFRMGRGELGVTIETHKLSDIITNPGTSSLNIDVVPVYVRNESIIGAAVERTAVEDVSAVSSVEPAGAYEFVGIVANEDLQDVVTNWKQEIDLTDDRVRILQDSTSRKMYGRVLSAFHANAYTNSTIMPIEDPNTGGAIYMAGRYTESRPVHAIIDFNKQLALVVVAKGAQVDV